MLTVTHIKANPVHAQPTHQIVNATGRVVNGVWNGKTPMTHAEAKRKIALMHAQGGGSYRAKKISKSGWAEWNAAHKGKGKK